METKMQQTLFSPNGPLNPEIREFMKRRGFTKIEELAQASGVGATTLYNLVLGKKTAAGVMLKPSLDTLQRLAETLQIPMHELVYKVSPEAFGSDQLQAPPVVQVPIRVAGWVGAGPTQAKDSETEVFVEESFAAGKNLVAFRIFGDSMQGGKRPIFDGDTVIVNQNDKSLDGFAVVARISDDGYVCKKPLLSAHGRLQQLVSTNLDYDDPAFRVIDRERVAEIVGRVVRIIHDTP